MAFELVSSRFRAKGLGQAKKRRAAMRLAPGSEEWGLVICSALQFGLQARIFAVTYS